MAHKLHIHFETFTLSCQVGERHKIRLPNEISERFSHLAKSQGPVKAIAIPGTFGGIQIVFGQLGDADLRSRIDQLVRDKKVTSNHAKENWTLLARNLANAWGVTFSKYEKTYTLVLPEVARDLGYVPQNQGENVIIFVCGDIFEIWRPEDWNALNKDTHARIESLKIEFNEIDEDRA